MSKLFLTILRCYLAFSIVLTFDVKAIVVTILRCYLAFSIVLTFGVKAIVVKATDVGTHQGRNIKP